MKKFLIVIVVILNLVLINSCKKEPPVTYEVLYTLQGKVLDLEKGNPIHGASIFLGGAGAFSDTDGYFIFKNIVNHKYTLSVSYPDYETYSETLDVSKNESLIIYLSKKIPLFNLSGTILDSAKHTPIVGALVTIGEFEDSTDISGHFSFSNLKSGEYVLSTTHPYYVNYSQNINISNDTTISLSFLMKQIEFFQLNLGQTKYYFNYDRTTPSPRPSSVQTRGIATWDIVEIFKRDSYTVYNVLESRNDTIVKFEWGTTTNSVATVTLNFEILEDSNHVLYSAKFPDGFSVPRYVPANFKENFMYPSAYNGFIYILRDIGINEILKAYGFISSTTNGEYTRYRLIR
ncbi:MAG: carboxypeptidase-like regulatory domain-containing protein [Ignavibacteriaceae bacterium]|jgi:hypothetical protein